MHAGFVPGPQRSLRRLPLAAFGPIGTFNIGPDPEMLLICTWICECDKYRDAGRRKSQHCLTTRARAYDIMRPETSAAGSAAGRVIGGGGVVVVVAALDTGGGAIGRG